MPRFPQTLHEEAHSACFLGRILEPGMSLQAKEGKSWLQDEFRPWMEGAPSSGAAGRLGSGLPRWPWHVTELPQGSFSNCESDKGQQLRAEGSVLRCPRAHRPEGFLLGKTTQPKPSSFLPKSSPQQSRWTLAGTASCAPSQSQGITVPPANTHPRPCPVSSGGQAATSWAEM